MANHHLPHSHQLHSSQSHLALRQWQSANTTTHSPYDFVLPLFIINDDDKEVPIQAMPGVSRRGINLALQYLQPLVMDLGLKSVLLFPVLDDKQLDSATDATKNAVLRLVPLLRSSFPDLLIVVDVCLCTFTPDGHCCLFDEGRMDNQSSINKLADIALAYARAGVHVVAPSDMMDGRVSAIKHRLRSNSYDVAVLSYSAKFASCFYGPFREAAGSAPQFGDRKCYQLPPGSKGLAMRAIERDIVEGADMVMVKPGLPYLDLVSQIAAKHPDIPIAVYHVSGEYAMLWHGAQGGAFDLKTAVMEVITSFKRAGSNIIITYYTPQILQWIKE